MRRAVPLLLVFVFALPGSALAGWGPPVRFARGASEPHIALLGDGTTLAVWRSGRSIRAAFRPPGGSFGRAATLARGRLSAVRLSAAPSGEAVALWRDKRHLFAGVRLADGRFGAGRRLARARAILLSDVKVAANGTAVAVWEEVVSSKSVRIRAARHAPGARGFGAPFTVARGAEIPRLAVDAAGNGVVAYSASERRLGVRRLPAAGGVGPEQSLVTRAGAFRIAVGPAGHALLAWTTFNDGLDALQTAYGLPNAPLGPREEIEPDLGRGRFGAGIDLAGNATLVWISLERGTTNYHLRTATRTPTAGFAAFATIANGYFDHARLAVNPRGDAVAAWWGDVGQLFRHLGSVRPAGAAAFAPPVVLGSAAQGNDFAPDVTINAAGRAAAVWLANPDRTRRGVGDAFLADYAPG